MNSTSSSSSFFQTPVVTTINSNCSSFLLQMPACPSTAFDISNKAHPISSCTAITASTSGSTDSDAASTAPAAATNTLSILSAAAVPSRAKPAGPLDDLYNETPVQHSPLADLANAATVEAQKINNKKACKASTETMDSRLICKNNWIDQHPDGTKYKFKVYWAGLNANTHKPYNNHSADLKKAKHSSKKGGAKKE
ncbi:hypothetical protein GYMLUDRAFT_251633 [Collybiopsis luxurians FD-317 M1]|uniref:Uncharacterized protein n=1 Tax=Collybiopsis luxurians FD-317 M1 TaxID=944289 RepID=A0A0D0CAT8_9AGAR|nr:hypothetical protein GYMLUDRAFT_251633 [Collybiopsis luxurians FD-317 M1]